MTKGFCFNTLEQMMIVLYVSKIMSNVSIQLIITTDNDGKNNDKKCITHNMVHYLFYCEHGV